MDIEQAILRAQQLKISQANIAYILDIQPEKVRTTLIKAGKATYGKPSNIPSGYYKDRLAKGFTVMDIAKELNCTRSAIYKVLQQRDIDIHHYTAHHKKGDNYETI